MAEVRVQVRVSGLVQQVGFRMFAVEAAQSLGVRGAVCNTHDGAIELVAEGERAALESLVAMMRQGPRAARVESVLVAWSAATGEFADFSARRTLPAAPHRPVPPPSRGI